MFFFFDAASSPRGLCAYFHFSQYKGCNLVDGSGDWQHSSPYHLCLVGLFVSEVPWDRRSEH